MKKLVILALSTLLIASMATGCRKNVGEETATQNTTQTTTHSTSAPTTKPATRPTETTRPTEATRDTEVIPMPSGTIPGTEEGTRGNDATGHGRIMPPRY